MGIEENKKTLQRLFDEVWNNENLDAMDECFTEDFVRHGIGGTSIDLKTYKEFLVNTHKAFPDIHRSLDEMVAEGDKIAFSFTWTGTDTGGFTGTPTGKKLAVEECYITRFENGKIVEIKQHADALGMLRELGVIPTMKEIQAQKQKEKTEEENKKLIQEYYDEVINKADYTNIDKYLHDDFGGDTSRGAVSGKEAHIQHFETPRAICPDLYLTINRMVEEGDTVVIHITTTGTHTGIDAYGKPASGKKINFSGINIYDFKDGKIVKGTAVGDMLGLCQQLGVYPPLPE